MRDETGKSAIRARSRPAAACRPTAGVCADRPPLEERSLVSAAESASVAALFKMLASDTRIRLLHHVARRGEATVTDIAKNLGMKPQAVSNQLTRLSDTGVLAWRRDGNNVFYRLANGCVAPLLDLALCLMEAERSNSNGKGRL